MDLEPVSGVKPSGHFQSRFILCKCDISLRIFFDSIAQATGLEYKLSVPDAKLIGVRVRLIDSCVNLLIKVRFQINK